MRSDAALVDMRDKIGGILANIFATLAPLPLEALPEAPVPVRFEVAAFVSLVGRRRFMVILLSGEHLACRIFETMTGSSRKSWDADVADAFGEVANITAGNLKTIMDFPGLVQSTPTVARGGDFHTPNLNASFDAVFSVDGEPLVVRVAEERDPASAQRIG